MPNKTCYTAATLPPITHTQDPVPPLLPFISDAYLLLILPTIAYWAYGLLFYWIDQNGYLARYRLHTPAELLKRNRVPMSTVVYSILFYQLITTALGLWLMRNAAPDFGGREEDDIARWILRIREIGNGLDILQIALAKMTGASKAFSPAKGSSQSPHKWEIRPWELATAKAIYVYLVPAFQYALAIFVADTWQYFEHRIVHMNHYLYSECCNPLTNKGASPTQTITLTSLKPPSQFPRRPSSRKSRPPPLNPQKQ